MKERLLAKPKTVQQPDIVLPKRPKLAVLPGISVDPDRTKDVDQVFHVENQTLYFGVPVSCEPVSENLSYEPGTSLMPNLLVPGLICAVDFGNDGFSEPHFYTGLIENKKRITPEEFGETLVLKSDPQISHLEVALRNFHRARLEDVIPWVSTDPYEALMGEPRLEKHRSTPLSRTNGFISDLSLLIHHLAGEFLRSQNAEALFIARTVKIVNGESKTHIDSYHELLDILNLAKNDSQIDLVVSPQFWTSKSIKNMGEGGYVTPCTCPLRSLVARINVDIIRMICEGMEPKNLSSELRAFASLRNAEFRKRKPSYDSVPRTVQLSIQESEKGLLSVTRIPSLHKQFDKTLRQKELARYNSECIEVRDTLLKTRPTPAHIAFAISAFDRSRKDWNKVKHAVLICLKAYPEMTPEILFLLRKESLASDKDQGLNTLLNLLQVSTKSFSDFPFKTRGFLFSDLPDTAVSQRIQYSLILHNLAQKLGLQGIVFTSVNRNKDKHSSSHKIQSRIKVGSYTYESEVCEARTKNAAKHKASASLLKILMIKGIIPWEFVKSPSSLPKGAKVTPPYSSITYIESNSENWEMIRDLRPLLTTFELLLHRQSGFFEWSSADGITNQSRGHIILRTHINGKDYITIESVSADISHEKKIHKLRDAVKRTLRYLLAQGAICTDDLNISEQKFDGIIYQNPDSLNWSFRINGIEISFPIAHIPNGFKDGRKVSAKLEINESSGKYQAIL